MLAQHIADRQTRQRIERGLKQIAAAQVGDGDVGTLRNKEPGDPQPTAVDAQTHHKRAFATKIHRFERWRLNDER